MDGLSAESFAQDLGLTCQLEMGRAGGLTSYLNILPSNAPRPTGTQRFEQGFLCCETHRIMRSWICVGDAIFLLLRSENALNKAVPVSREGFAQSRDFDSINSDTDNHFNSGKPFDSGCGFDPTFAL